MVFLVKAPPRPLKSELAPLPPAYYDPKPHLPPSEPLQPWDPNLDHEFGMPIDIQEEETQFQIKSDSDIVKQQEEGFSDYYDDNKNSRFDSWYQQNSQRKPLVCCVLILEMVNEGKLYAINYCI